MELMKSLLLGKNINLNCCIFDVLNEASEKLQRDLNSRADVNVNVHGELHYEHAITCSGQVVCKLVNKKSFAC